MKNVLKTCGFLIGLCLGAAGCAATVRFQEDPALHAERLDRLQAQLAARPNDAETLREVGVIYTRTAQYGQAYEFLKQAYAQNPDDPKTLFYLGLASEAVGNRDAGLRLYEKYPEVPRVSPYRRLMAGRYHWLNRELTRLEMQTLLAREATIDSASASPRVVAVFPFTYQGSEDRYAPLGLALSEMLAIDLANVSSLRVVERARLQALLDEMALGETGYLDPAGAPRAGRLLGAGRVVGGTYNVLGGDDVHLDVGVWDWRNAPAPALQPSSDALANLFRLEKAIALSLIDEMGIALTAEERARIETIPTQNLQAFLAYGRGLALENAGAFGEAARFYEQAAGLDPGFAAAGQRAEAAEGMVAASGTTEAAVGAAVQLEPPLTPVVDVLEHRTGTLAESIRANYLPGQDARRPDQEAYRPDLYDPPNPPERD